MVLRFLGTASPISDIGGIPAAVGGVACNDVKARLSVVQRRGRDVRRAPVARRR